MFFLEKLLIFAKSFVPITSLLFVVACGGGGGGGGGSADTYDGRESTAAALRATPTLTTPEPTVAQVQAQRSVEFTGVDGGVRRGTITAANSKYAMLGIDYARAAGLTGAGITLAILDEGFLIRHEALAADGRTVTYAGGVTLSGSTFTVIDAHGTNVASVVGGTDNDANGEMFGIAPDANLYLMSYNTVTGTSASPRIVSDSYTGLGTKLRGAADADAIAVNNSWGDPVCLGGNFTTCASNTSLVVEGLVSHIQEEITNNGLTLVQAVDKISIRNVTFADFISGLQYFQQNGGGSVGGEDRGGIVVFAISNNGAGALDYTPGGTNTDIDFSAGLPVLQPDLADNWLTVANFSYTEADGNVASYTLESGYCGPTALYCLAAPSSSMYMATYNGDQSVTDAYTTDLPLGTSFGAPMVTGMIGLLAEAFPNLTANQLKQRLLASADASIFTPSEEVIRNHTFADGVVREYSDRWGFGIPNMEGALKPIGEIAFTRGGNLESASRYSIDESHITLPKSDYGSDFVEEMEEIPVVFFDALGGDFQTTLGSVMGDSDAGEDDESGDLSERSERMAMQMRAGVRQDVSPLTLGFSSKTAFTPQLFTDATTLSTVVRMQTSDTQAFGFSYGANLGQNVYNAPVTLGLLEDRSSILSLMDNSSMLFADQKLDEDTSLRVFGFTGTQNAEEYDLDTTGAGFSMHHRFDESLTLNFGSSLLAEHDSFVGFRSEGAFALSDAGLLTSAHLGFTYSPVQNLKLTADYEFAHANDISEASDALIQGFSDVKLEAWSLNASVSNLFSKEDALGFQIRKPLQFTSGALHMRLPSSRTLGSDILYEDIALELAPEKEQLDFGLSYQYKLSKGTMLALAGMHSLNYEQQANKDETQFLLRIQHDY